MAKSQYNILPDDAMHTISDALGREVSDTHFGMPSQHVVDRNALAGVDRRQAQISPRNKLDKCICRAWICEHKKPPCYIAEGKVTSKKNFTMCDLDIDKSCTFEHIIQAILAAARQVIKEKAPNANRVVIWNDTQLKRSHARHGQNMHSPILSLDLESHAVQVWYGTRAWYCSKRYQLVERNGQQALVLKHEEK